MTVVMCYDKRYSCLSKTTVTCRHVTITILIVCIQTHPFNKICKEIYIILKIKIYDILHPPPLRGGPLCHD